MKKFLVLALTFSFLTFGVAQKRAEAAVGLAMLNPPMWIAGAVLVGLFFPFIPVPSSTVTSGFKAFNVIVLALGIILLDEQGNAHFAQVSPEAATKLNLSHSDVVIYNSELSELNAVSESVARDLNGVVDYQKAKASWDSYEANLSPETMKVAKALAQSALK
jgi:hypothetical protein